MKLSRIYYLLILALVTSLSACDKDDDNIYPQLGDDPRNLSEIISSTQDLSEIWQAITEANMDSILRTTSTYTVLAPNNAALEGSDLSGLSEEERSIFLLNHVLSTVTADFSSSLTTGYRSTMAEGPDETNLSLFINVEGDPTFNGMATLVSNASNIGSTNGVLHVIDGVLTPPTILDHANANPDFSLFAEAIEIAELSEALSVTDPENEDFPYTVFAPTNAAFENLLSQVNGAFGWSSLEEIPVEVLQQILMLHVVPGENVLSGAVAGTEPETLEGSTLTIDGESVISDYSYTGTNFLFTDVQAINGVIHAIDKVLLTDAVFQDILDSTLNLKERSEDRGFTSFLAAVEKAGLTSLLEDEDEEYTLFAPNNEAFEALFELINNFESLDDFESEEEIEALRQLLTYHIHEGSVMSSQLVNDDMISTVNGDEIRVDLTGTNARLRPSFEHGLPATITTPNIGATNGIIHGINRVLIPEDLVSVLGIDIDTGESGVCAVTDEDLVFFNWDDKTIYWGQVEADDDPALALDDSNFGRANFQTGTTGWVDLFWRNGGTLNGGEIVGNDLEGYSLKFDINVITPINEGMFRIRFNNSSGVDAFYNWAPWEDTGEPFSTDGWETIEIPLTAIGAPDYSLIDAEFGMAFEGADVLLDFAIDNVRFDTPGCGGPDPVGNPEAVFFDWDENGPWWGLVEAEDDPSISLDGSNYGRANFQTGGTGFTDLFWRNDASTFHGADMVGTNVDDYVLKFEILTFAPIAEGRFRFRFNASSGVDAFYDWQPWEETGEPFDTEGEWVTITIPVSALGQPDFSAVDAEFGMAFQDADVLLNFAIDNVRFEER